MGLGGVGVGVGEGTDSASKLSKLLWSWVRVISWGSEGWKGAPCLPLRPVRSPPAHHQHAVSARHQLHPPLPLSKFNIALEDPN